jgi:hypothetical protein
MSARDVLKAYEDRINSHDFDQLTDLIAADAVFWFSMAPRGNPGRPTGFRKDVVTLGS